MTYWKKAHAVLLTVPMTAALTLSAQAAGYSIPVVESPVIAPVPAPVGDWQGAYVGAMIGYAFGGDDTVALHRDGVASGRIGKFELSGPNAGLRAGYTWQRQSWVFGPELAVEGGNVKDDFSDEYEGSTKLKNAFALRFKTGYLVNDLTLVYGIVGASRAKFDYSVTGDGFFGPANIDDSFSRTGYIVGLGVERKLTDSLSLTGEYEYANYGKDHLNDGAGVSTPATPKFSNIKIGLNYRF
ncbi:outer membrane protein [Paenirhodobacter populi]|nr:outer membrane beta-barrel protein [Sinirhodobacter populi]